MIMPAGPIPRALPETDVTRERAAARITAYRLLSAASEALTTGQPPDYPPLPSADPRTLAVIGAALGAMARSALPKGYRLTENNQPNDGFNAVEKGTQHE